MSRLKDLLGQKKPAAPAAPMAIRTATPALAPAATPAPTGLTGAFRKARETAPKRPTHVQSSTQHYQPPTPPLDAVDALRNMQITVTNDMHSWPEGVDPADADNANASDETRLQAMLADVRNKLSSADVSDAMQRCLIFIKDRPALADILLPEDVNTLIQALQSSTGILLSERTQRASTRSKAKAEVEQTANELAELGDMFKL